MAKRAQYEVQLQELSRLEEAPSYQQLDRHSLDSVSDAVSIMRPKDKRHDMNKTSSTERIDKQKLAVIASQ